MGKLNIPDGLKLFGANIVPTAADVAPASGQLAWVNMMLNWNWAGWVKPQIDYLMGTGIGANCIRMIGAQDGIVTSAFSQNFHDDKILQVADYVTSQGGYYFACTGGTQSGLITAIGAGLQAEQLAEVQATTLKKVQRLPRIIGADLIQESQGGSIGSGYLIRCLNEVKRQGVTLPLTYSSSCVNTALNTPVIGPRGEDWLLSPTYGMMQQYFDFISVHLYFRTLDSTWFDQFYSAAPSQDIVIGEFGLNLAAGVSNQVNDYTRWLDMGNAPNPRIRGALAWACSDQAVADAERWGVYSETFSPRGWMLDTFRKYTFGSVAKCNAAIR